MTEMLEIHDVQILPVLSESLRRFSNAVIVEVITNPTRN